MRVNAKRQNQNNRMALNQRRRGGVALVYFTAVICAFTGIVSLAVDYSRVQLAKTELSAAADAAARSAANCLNTNPSGAVASAKSLVNGIKIDGAPIVAAGTVIELGTWNSSTQVFSPTGTSGATAARASLSLTQANGNPLHLMFASLFGQSTCDVHAQAVASLANAASGAFVGINSFTSQGLLTGDSFPSNAGCNILSNGNVTLNLLGLIGLTGVHGNVHPGVGGRIKYPLLGITAISGSSSALTSTLSYPSVNDSDYVTNNDNAQLPNWSLLSGNGNFLAAVATTIPAGTYDVNDFTLLANVVLRVDGPVTFYVHGNTTIAGSVLVASNDPSNFKIRVVDGAGPVSIAANLSLYADIYAPQSDVNILASLGYSGSIVGKTLNVLGTSFLHGDESIVHGTTIAMVK